MKNSKDSPFKIPLEFMNFVAIACVIVNVASERFGTYPSYTSGRFSRMEMIGILFPIVMLIVPIIEESYREKLWSMKNIIITVITLIISIFLIIVMYANKDFYRTLWTVEGHWTWDNCPPIRWDFWNIIGESAQ